MTRKILYHHDVEEDLESVGTAMARRIVRAIDQKLTQSPLEFGVPLSAGLADFRKLRVGDCRVVYQVRGHEVVVFVLAVGPRRDKEIYKAALRRKVGRSDIFRASGLEKLKK
ncbi:type II toxin-antitoxin system RelE/ParE family toxin [Desulfonatronum sp. SC1]|uniref:type II toxin-antitoxin system RelE family toxin n=1 Tax=Desulfonatronum sp. SC1 TaxID=2109626 RepID=UPI000D31EE26|nr:type II toxin-antitoxin system RelE/ParE family toxin [Desulfonatronum sp. SC1]PTN32689.1 plasmid stabilization protein [Desulfonatronum sp. SC1]